MMAAEPQVRKEDIVHIKLILIFAVLSAGIIATSYIAYSGYKKHYRTEVERELTSIADLKVAQVSRWIGASKEDAKLISSNVLFSNLARRYLRNQHDSAAERQLREWIGQYSKSYDYDQVRVLDTRGVTRMSSPEGLLPASAAVTNRIREVLQSGRITIVDFYQHDYDGRIYLSILIPIHDASAGKRTIGVLSLRVDPEKYLYPFILGWPTPSQTGETLLVRRDGNDALFLVDLRFRKDSALKHRIPLNRTDNPAVMAVIGRTGIVEGMDYRGQPVIADIRPVPDSPWFLVARKNTTEVYGQARGQLWLIVGFVTVLLFGSGAGLAFVWRQQSIAFYQVRNLAAHLQSVREEERTRIAREIHDELGQALTAQKMDLSWFRDKYGDHKPIFDKAVAMLDTLNATIRSVRRICTELRPSILDDFGLVEAIKWQADQFQKRTRIECTLDPVPEDIEIDKDRSTALFRIFQEALTNVLKHAEATKVKARLTKEKDNIILEVIDNGKGITDKQLSKPQSFGLIGMRERVYPWGGKVEVIGDSNKGTKIKVSMPHLV